MAMAFALGAPSQPVLAQDVQRIAYDIELHGLRMGQIALAARNGDGRYEVAGVMRSLGIAAAFRPFHFEARSTGSVNDAGQFRPDRYQEAADTGRCDTRTELVYTDGVPERVLAEPPEEFEGLVEPGTQGDTIDILSALYVLLRPQPAEQVCVIATALYDGRRRSLLETTGPISEEGGIRCEGRFQRLEGFTDEDLRDHASFPFTAVYQPGEDGLYRPSEISMASILGAVRLRPVTPRCETTATC